MAVLVGLALLVGDGAGVVAWGVTVGVGVRLGLAEASTVREMVRVLLVAPALSVTVTPKA